jgi:hypothetical protein
MMVIPISDVPAQTFNLSLGGQSCTIRIAQKTTGLFLDLLISNTLTIGGVLCLDRTRIVRDSYFGFNGDLFFVDTQGNSDPYYSELGDRYILVYAAASEL